MPEFVHAQPAEVTTLSVAGATFAMVAASLTSRLNRRNAQRW